MNVCVSIEITEEHSETEKMHAECECQMGNLKLFHMYSKGGDDLYYIIASVYM